MTAEEENVRWSGRHAIVAMPAEIDLTNSPGLGELLAGVVARSPETITVDLTATTFCDSAGISVLAHANELAAENGGELRIALGDSPVARIIHLIGLDEIVPVYHDVQQSLETAGPGSVPHAGG
jgi:anti-sigma B factor antagonist